jgi:plastocyanin
MEQNNNKHLLYAGLAIIVVIILALAMPYFKKTAVAPTTDTVVTTAAPVAAKPVRAAAPSAAMMAWNATLQKYAHQSVTFAADCTATPITQALKAGTTVLLVDNSTVSHTITINGQSYPMAGLHYRPIVLTGKGTTIINCDNKPNVANIGVE